MIPKFFYYMILVFCFLLMPGKECIAQDKINEKEDLKIQLQSQNLEIEQLNQKLDNQASAIQQKLGTYASSFMVLFLFGAFCALWAQNTNRNPLLWFFAGVIFNLLAVLLVLSNNYRDIRQSSK